MDELIVRVAIVVAAMLQAYCSGRSPRSGVAFYIICGPLAYFSTWVGATITLDRLLGLILILGVWARRRGAQKVSGSRQLAHWWGYCVIITIVGSFFWPVFQSASESSLHSNFRWLVQIVNMTITVGSAYAISATLQSESDLEWLYQALTISVLILAGYGIYQYIAYNLGLPATGIRRPYEFMVGGVAGEQVASYYRDGELIHRPGSFLGEPKALGKHSVLWILLLLNYYWLRRRTLTALALGAAGVALVLTSSTSAYAACCMTLFLLPLFGAGRQLMRSAPVGQLCALGAVVSVLGLIYPDAVAGAAGRAATVISERLYDRLETEGMLTDEAEEAAVGIMLDEPHKVVFGVGTGGAFFYIAERLGNAQVLVRSLSSGFLLLLFESGLIGVMLLSAIVLPPLSRQRLLSPRHPKWILGVAGLSTLIGVFVFYEAFSLTLSLAFLMSVPHAAKWGTPSGQPQNELSIR